MGASRVNNDAAELAEREARTSARGLSELERAHGAVLESEARFRLLSQLAPVGIVQTDLDGSCTFANDRWCELTGMTAQEAIGADWTASLHPGDMQRIAREWERAAATDGELRTDCRLRPAGPDPVWVHIAVVPFLAADGRACGFLAAVTNVSERKRAEAEREKLLTAERAARRSLAEQTERLNGLVNAAIPGILLDDEHGRITQLNQSFCDLFGIAEQPSQLIGGLTARIAFRIRRVFADPDEFLRRASELVARRRPVVLEEIACADGRTLEWDFAPVFVDGDYRGNLWGVGDATDRQQLTEQRERLLEAELAAREAAEIAQLRLAEQNARLRELDEAKTQFISTMSHELRTPLTSIVSFTELIMDDEEELSEETASSRSSLPPSRFPTWSPIQLAPRRPPRPIERSPSMSPPRTGPPSRRIGSGSSRSSTTCCPTRSSSPVRMAGSWSTPPTTAGVGGLTWRMTESASRLTISAVCSAASSVPPTPGRRGCRVPASGCR